MKKKIEELYKEWEKLGQKFAKQGREHEFDSQLQERYFVMSETYDYCADRLRRLLKDA